MPALGPWWPVRCPRTQPQSHYVQSVRRNQLAGAVASPVVPSLKDYVVRVLGDAKEPMRVKDIENGIVSAGYTTKGKSLPNQVSMALADLAKTRKVKKVARGLYRG